jgi:hypothetical protein
MIPKEKADLRLNCLYAAITITGVRDGSASAKGKQGRPTTEDVLVEAKKLSKWVSGKKGDDK